MDKKYDEAKIARQLEKLLSNPQNAVAYEASFAKPIRSFGDRFFVINFTGDILEQVKMLLEFLSSIHKYYSQDRFIIARLNRPEKIMGTYWMLKYILVSKKYSGHELATITHEIGHFIEIFDVLSTSHNEKCSAIRKAYIGLSKEISNSTLVKKLKYKSRDKTLTQEEKELLEYYLRPQELFARSYTYYIYRKLFKHIKGLYKKDFKPTIYSRLADKYIEQYTELYYKENDNMEVLVHWDDKKEFAKIEKAWDKLLNSFGSCKDI